MLSTPKPKLILAESISKRPISRENSEKNRNFCESKVKIIQIYPKFSVFTLFTDEPHNLSYFFDEFWVDLG